MPSVSICSRTKSPRINSVQHEFPKLDFCERSDNHGGGNVADVITEIDDDCHSSSDKRE